MRGPCLVALGLLGVGLLPGCNIVGPALILTAPPQMKAAEVKVTDKRLALVIEYARPAEENPVFTGAFCQRLVEVFRDKRVNQSVVPQAELLRLRRDNVDFREWSLQKIGRALNAEQVLYVRIDRLRLCERQGGLLLAPEVRMHLKLIAPWERSENVRLWPPREEREGRLIQRGRPMQEAVDTVAVDEEAAKLGRDAAWLAAKPFYKYDLEEKDPWER